MNSQHVSKRRPRAAALAFAAMLLLVSLAFAAAPAQRAYAAANVSNPLTVVDPSLDPNRMVTWDCVWFGSYPQTEARVWGTLASQMEAADWDANGDAVVNGTKYRRISLDDVVNSWSWDDDGAPAYRYFKYEPIKWRVLKESGTTAFVVADSALDLQEYNTNSVPVTWETSSMRSWLNGYGPSHNQPNIDFSTTNFIGSAFSADEQAAIRTTKVENADNLEYGTEGGSDTHDKVFLLSESEAWGRTSTPYGFVSNPSYDNDARKCSISDYACVAETTKSSQSEAFRWWLRSPGDDSHSAANVCSYHGEGSEEGSDISVCRAVRPALTVDLSSPYIIAAGTVRSFGWVDEDAETGQRGKNAGWLLLSTDLEITGLKDKVYTGKPIVQAPTVRIDGTTLRPGVDYTYTTTNNRNAGTAEVAIIGTGKYYGTFKTSFKIARAENPARVVTTPKTVRKAALKKRAVAVEPLTVSNAKGKVTFAKVAKGSSRALAVNAKTGKVKVRKGAAKGTHRIRIKVSVAGAKNYQPLTKVVTATVHVK